MKSCVRDVMATRVVAVRKTASFKEMIVGMRKARVSAFPVVDDQGRVIGVVSHADMLDKEADLATGPGPLASVLRFRDHEKAAGVTAAELMTSPPVTAGPDTSLAEAARLMRDHRVKRLPVINATGHLIGIVSRADVLSVFTRPDADIHREATEEVIAESILVDSRSGRRHGARWDRDTDRPPGDRPGRPRPGGSGAAHRRGDRCPRPTDLPRHAAMTHRHDRTLATSGLARVEGEGAMHVRVRGSHVDEVRLEIYEPPRFFEAFLRGRSYTEPPDITARVCGICPVAYQTSACQAIEDACGAQVDGQIAGLRRLLYCGEWIGSHALHIYMLHAPDFLGYPGIVEMAADHRGWWNAALPCAAPGTRSWNSSAAGRSIR